MRKLFFVAALLALLLAACAMYEDRAANDTNGMAGMDVSGDMGSMEEVDGAPRLPAVSGLFDGEKILFVHSEASDPKVAEMLTNMMDSPVVVVPELAEVPEESLGNVFVFTNGVKASGAQGPMGFQPDVFDSSPSEAHYSPLRAVNLVTWSDDSEPRLLRSLDEIEIARRNGELSIEATDVIVNMPFLKWPGGER